MAGPLQEKIKDVLMYSPIVVGAYLGATVFADHSDSHYSPERIEAIEADIEQLDSQSRDVIGQENTCEITTYNALRAQNAFPTDREEIRNVFVDTCDTAPAQGASMDERARLLESYKVDIDKLEAELNDQADFSETTLWERVNFGMFGALGGISVSAGIKLFRETRSIRPKNVDKS